MNRILTILVCLTATCCIHAQGGKNEKMDRFIDQLISKMTLEDVYKRQIVLLSMSS